MTDKTLTENDEEELIVVETPTDREPDPEDDKVVEEEKPAVAAEEDDDEEDDGDERVGTSEDDNDEDITSANRARRRKRREMQKRAKEAAERKIAMLEQRLAQLEGRTVSSEVQTIEQKIAQAQQEIRQAEHIIAKATEAGNGEDVVVAMRLREEAVAEAARLAAAKQQFAQRPAPQVDPRVVNYAKQWMDANPWYDPQGRDRDSAVTKAIDNELVKEGFNPASPDYWQELTARVSEALVDDDTPEPAKKQTPDRPKRKAPPTGTTREHAPQSTKREIYVTPERKQAMIDAGVWEDPVLRQRYLKAYQAYDHGSAR